MLSAWFSLFFLFRFLRLESQLFQAERNLYIAVAIFYPLTATWVKWLIVENIISGSFWVNRLEHGVWAIATIIVLFPFLKTVKANLTQGQFLLFILGLICLLGNLNELFEYSQWVGFKSVNTQRLAHYYSDTIYDLMMNLSGGAIGFLILESVHRSHSANPSSCKHHT